MEGVAEAAVEDLIGEGVIFLCVAGGTLRPSQWTWFSEHSANTLTVH